MPDIKYGGYSVQKERKFLWFRWWTNECLCPDYRTAIKLVAKLKLDDFYKSKQ
jgi:hypothetical protein